MSRDLEQRLDDIIESCDRVADYISGYGLAKFEAGGMGQIRASAK